MSILIAGNFLQYNQMLKAHLFYSVENQLPIISTVLRVRKYTMDIL